MPPDHDPSQTLPGFAPLPMTDRGGAAFGRYLQQLRDLIDATMLTDAAEAAYDEAAARLAAVEALLEPRVGEAVGPAGRRPDLPGRGQPLLPAFRVHEVGPDGLHAEVVFSAAFVGWRSAHGGAIGLLFDELLGVVAALTVGEAMRTAYLNIQYRALTPLDVPLQVRTRIDRREGRKIFVTGEIRDGHTVCAEAECLFVTVPLR